MPCETSSLGPPPLHDSDRFRGRRKYSRQDRPRQRALQRFCSRGKKSGGRPAKKPKGGKTIVVRQVRSPNRRPEVQRETLIGLGLNKMHKTRELEDTPSVRGMITKVNYLVKVTG